MAISNMQQSRQLRAGGGIMDLEPRQKYGFGSFVKKAFKKVARPIKKIAKSPLGKAALLYAGTAGLGSIGRGATGFGRLSSGNFLAGLGKARSGFSNLFKAPGAGGKGGGFLQGLVRNKAGGLDYGKMGLLGLGLGATALPFLAGGGDEEEEVVESFSSTPGSISDIVSMARAKDPSLRFMPNSQYVQKNFYKAADGGIARLSMGGGAGQEQMMQALQAEYMKYKQNGGTMPFEQFAKAIMQQQQGGQQTQMAANGGRIGYANAGPVMEEDVEVINEDRQEVASNSENDRILELLFEKYLDMGMSMEEAEAAARMELDQMSQGPAMEETMVEDRVMANAGGMMDYMSSANPMADSYLMEDTDIVNMYRPGGDRQPAAEGGIMDLGGMEKDYRAEGGFVPIGGQEKADDVPARLSKNEFVFTADAVRNAGGGDIDAGAEVMENMMNHLEQGGQISEESQGENPAQEMFDTAQQLESRIA